MKLRRATIAVALGIGCGPPDASAPPPAAPSELRFAVVGDTRPPGPDDTASYPSDVIAAIWRAIEGETPRVPFAVSTGDYMFASPSRGEQSAQLALYANARAAFSGVHYAALGNHECTGATASNCGAGNRDGVTANYAAFAHAMLEPIGIDRAYYVVHVAPPDRAWSAKLVVVACNAWDDTQASWIDGALAEPTTYTFVVRHEPTRALAQTPCAASAAIIASHPLTLLVVGHTHAYHHYASDREIVVGIGGAPLTSSTGYGYAIVSREPSGAIGVTAYEVGTHAVIDAFAIDAAGAPR
jgi:hypothetical protein